MTLAVSKLVKGHPACCGKPRGCTMTHQGCAYLRHPWKRAMLFGDPTVRCQATRLHPELPGVVEQCVLPNGHEGGHEL